MKTNCAMRADIYKEYGARKMRALLLWRCTQ
nr:MAG TPA: hypothetical protein [Caudoviricetes sp.]